MLKKEKTCYNDDVNNWKTKIFSNLIKYTNDNNEKYIYATIYKFKTGKRFSKVSMWYSFSYGEFHSSIFTGPWKVDLALSKIVSACNSVLMEVTL